MCIVVGMRIDSRWRRLLFAPAAMGLALAAAGSLVTQGEAQQPHDASAAQPQLAFEVATIKPVDTTRPRPSQIRVYPGGRMVIRGFSLLRLITTAWDLPYWQVVSTEQWVNSSRFDVEGKPPEDVRDITPVGEYSNAVIHDARVRSMLQALLIERFDLRFHLEKQAGAVCLLQRGAGPLRLEPLELNLYTKSKDGSFSPSGSYPTGDTGLASGKPVAFYKTSMFQLADLLGDLKHCPVRDETGLQGFYNFTSKTVVTDEDFKAGDPMHLLVDAVPEMGLKLVKTQGVVEKFVIDHVQQPSPN
jgi:uncharacterized protein (TIGR03435 family)